MARWSVSFKRREEFLFEYIQEQFDPLAYIKMLVYDDMKKKGLIESSSKSKEIKDNEDIDKNLKNKEYDSDDFELEINF